MLTHEDNVYIEIVPFFLISNVFFMTFHFEYYTISITNSLEMNDDAVCKIAKGDLSINEFV